MEVTLPFKGLMRYLCENVGALSLKVMISILP